MKKLLLLLGLGVAAHANTCSNFVVDAVMHNSFRVRWNNDDATGSTQVQVQYGATSSYGAIAGDSNPRNAPIGTPHIYTVPGLAPNTLYHFAAQSTGNTAGTYCAAVDQTVTTSAAVTHPVYPTPPATYKLTQPTPTGINRVVGSLTCPGSPTWTSVFPGTTGCVQYATLQSAITSGSGGTAVATFGDQILISHTDVQGFALSNPLRFADAPDAASLTAIDASGNWTCAVTNCGGLTTGKRVILGWGYNFSGPSFGVTNDSLPLPFIPGYPYWVTVTGSTFRASLTNGGATVVPIINTSGEPAAGCYIVADANGNVPVPANGPIVIRSVAADSQWPPFGVRMNPIAFPAYAALTAQIQNQAPDNTLPAVALYLGGCAHDYWFGPGVEFNYQSVGTVNELDGPSYENFVQTSPANYRITFDRIWMHGKDYPERDNKAFQNMEGHNISLVSSTVSGLNLWTPSFSSLPLAGAMFSATITIPSGRVYFGNGVNDSLPLAGTLVINTSTCMSSCNGVFEADRSGFYLTMPTGTTGTCTIAGQPCTVTVSGSTNPTYATSGGYFTRVAIALPTLSNSTVAWVTTGENAPTGASNGPGTAGQEGSNAFGITNGPGPYLIDNNNWVNNVGTAGAFYSTGQTDGLIVDAGACAAANSPTCLFQPLNPGDITFSRNTVIIDDQHFASASNSLWNGAFYSMRQMFENKEGARIRFIGNYVRGAFASNFTGRGYQISLSARGGVINQNSDIEFGWNTFDTSAQGIQIPGGGVGSNSGLNGSTGTGDSQILQQRIWMHDNTMTGIDQYGRRTNNSFTTTGGNNGIILSIQEGSSDITIEHNYFGPPKGPSPWFCIFAYNLTEGLAIRNNVISYSNDNNNGTGNGCGANSWAPGATPNPTSLTAAALLPAVNPVNFIWATNVMFPAWQTSSSNTEMSNTQVTTQQGDWSALVGSSYFLNPTCTVGTNCIASRALAIGFQSYANTGGIYNLLYNSPFQSGGAQRGSDGLAVGPDYQQMIIQQGIVQGARALTVGSTITTLSWYAPDSFPCTVDYGAGADTSFATTTIIAAHQAPTLAADPRSQSFNITGLSPSTSYVARINCAVQQPVVGIETHR